MGGMIGGLIGGGGDATGIDSSVMWQEDPRMYVDDAETDLLRMVGEGSPHLFNVCDNMNFHDHLSFTESANWIFRSVSAANVGDGDYFNCRNGYQNFYLGIEIEMEGAFNVYQMSWVHYNGVTYQETFNGNKVVFINKKFGQVFADPIQGLNINAETNPRLYRFVVRFAADFGASARAKVEFKSQTANFVVGETITGATSGTKAVIMEMTDSGSTGFLYCNAQTAAFTANEIITGNRGGSATVKISTNVGYKWVFNAKTSQMNESWFTSDSILRSDDELGVTIGFGGKLGAPGFSAGGLTAPPIVNPGGGYVGSTNISFWYGMSNGFGGAPGCQKLGTGAGIGGSSYVIFGGAGGGISSVTLPEHGKGYDPDNLPIVGFGGGGYTEIVPVIMLAESSRPCTSSTAFGDSYMAGEGSEPNLRGTYGHILRKYGAYNRVATNGNSGSGFINYMPHAKAAIEEWAAMGFKMTHGLIAHGVNDWRLNPFASDATPSIQNTMNTFAAWLRGLFPGVKIGMVTVCPSTSSTDAFTTTANQTPYTYGAAAHYEANGHVQSYNTKMRAKDGVDWDFLIDLAAAVSDPLEPHKWRTDCFDTVGSAPVMVTPHLSTVSSTSTVTYGTGNKAFVAESGKHFGIGCFVKCIANDGSGFMLGSIPSVAPYNPTTGALTVNVTHAFGTGTPATGWTIKAVGRATPDGIHIVGPGLQYAMDVVGAITLP